jgi:hypothetical protein
MTVRNSGRTVCFAVGARTSALQSLNVLKASGSKVPEKKKHMEVIGIRKPLQQ